MSNGFEKIKKIGVQKIHEATHIARVHVEAILDENFDNMNNVQLLGFISILEREYAIDLSELRAKVKEHFTKNTPDASQNIKTVKVFAPSQRKTKSNLIYAAVAAIVVLTVLFFIFRPQGEQQKASVDNSAIQNAQKTIEAVAEDKNTNVSDENLSVKIQETQLELPPPSLKIMPKEKVWLGYIDLADHKKHQTIVSEEISLDPSKEWLLVFGHGHINIDINGTSNEFKTPNTIRFSYIGSILKEITLEEFKELNKGSGW